MPSESYKKRVVDGCLRVMRDGTVSRRHTRSVLRCSDVDASVFEPFLLSEKRNVRWAAATIVAMKGDVSVVADHLHTETDNTVLVSMIEMIGTVGGSVEEIVMFLNHDSGIVREAATQSIRRAGREDLLLPLLLVRDEKVNERAKRFISGADREDKKATGS